MRGERGGQSGAQLGTTLRVTLISLSFGPLGVHIWLWLQMGGFHLWVFTFGCDCKCGGVFH